LEAPRGVTDALGGFPRSAGSAFEEVQENAGKARRRSPKCKTGVRENGVLWVSLCMAQS
jgi:hypothetical protein